MSVCTCVFTVSVRLQLTSCNLKIASIVLAVAGNPRPSRYILEPRYDISGDEGGITNGSEVRLSAGVSS